MTNRSRPLNFTMERRMTLFRYLIAPPVSFDGWTIEAIKDRAQQDLKFPLDVRNVKSVIKSGGIQIKIKRDTNPHSPISVIHNKVKMLTEAHLKLCETLGYDPDPNVLNMFKEE